MWLSQPQDFIKYKNQSFSYHNSPIIADQKSVYKYQTIKQYSPQKSLFY